MKINRIWAMPNKWTFTIKPIKELLSRYVDNDKFWCDPFAGEKSPAQIKNDLSGKVEFCMDALDFLKTRRDGEFDGVLFDPPYSPRQVSECYKKYDRTVNMETTQASFWGNLKKEIARVVKNDGIVISCGWNSGGISKSLGFKIKEILLVPHGGWHNDTIVTVEIKEK